MSKRLLVRRTGPEERLLCYIHAGWCALLLRILQGIYWCKGALKKVVTKKNMKQKRAFIAFRWLFKFLFKNKAKVYWKQTRSWKSLVECMHPQGWWVLHRKLCTKGDSRSFWWHKVLPEKLKKLSWFKMFPFVSVKWQIDKEKGYI